MPDLDDEALVLAGINDYDAMCVSCHGAPGKNPGPTGLGLNPPAPDLAQSASSTTPAELSWVTKHGIRMTGMPVWGATHSDDAIWPAVAFTARLPDLDASGYQELLSAAAGHGHHAEASANVESRSAGSDEVVDDEVHTHEDGSSHVH